MAIETQGGGIAARLSVTITVEAVHLAAVLPDDTAGLQAQAIGYSMLHLWFISKGVYAFMQGKVQ